MAFHYPVSKRKKKIANPNPRFPPTRYMHVFLQTVYSYRNFQTAIFSDVPPNLLQVFRGQFGNIGYTRKDAFPWKEPFIQIKIAMKLQPIPSLLGYLKTKVFVLRAQSLFTRRPGSSVFEVRTSLQKRKTGSQ